MRLGAEGVHCCRVSIHGRNLVLGNKNDDFVCQASLAGKLLVDEPLVLAGPAPRRDQHRELDQAWRQLRSPAQLLAELLQPLRELGMVDQRSRWRGVMACVLKRGKRGSCVILAR